MEIRKVQLTGSSSYVITLPKEWITSHGIKKNDPLGIIVQPDGTLLITWKTKGKQIHRTKEFYVDDIDDATYLFRLLVSAYINGYSTVIIKSKERIKSFVRECAINFTQTAIGPEIIEETIKSITIKDLLNPAEMPFDKTIKRMYILARTMHEDAITALKKKNKSLAGDIEPRDRDVDRLHWLISRQFNILLKDMTLSERMNITQDEATYLFLMSRLIERIGDHGVKIAKNVPVLIDKKVNAEMIEMIASASNNSLKILTSAIDAWSNKDIKGANENIESIKNLVSSCEEINNNALNVKGMSSISTGYIAESIRRTGEYSADISELLLNHLVKE